MNQTEALSEVTTAGLVWFMHRHGLGVASSFGNERSCAQFITMQRAAEAPDFDLIRDKIHISRVEPMDSQLVGRVHAIFKEAYRRHGSEMFLHLGWNPTKKRYFISAPRCQAVSSGYLKYNAASGRFVGTIHSHGSMGAFFSSDDDRNEKGDINTAPGIYAVMGAVPGLSPVLAASIAGMGLREDITNILFPGITQYEMSQREADYWLRTLQSADDIKSKTTGYYLVDPVGSILRWAEVATELAKYSDKADRILPVTTARPVHAVRQRRLAPWDTTHASLWPDGFAMDHFWADSHSARPFNLDFNTLNSRDRPKRKRKTVLEKFADIIDKTNDLIGIVDSLDLVQFNMLCDAVDFVRQRCKQKKEESQSSSWGAEESDFTLWTP